MIRRRMLRRNPPLHRVAALASASVSPLQKLSAVRVGFVAIRAEVVGDRGPEVLALMAGDA